MNNSIRHCNFSQTWKCSQAAFPLFVALLLFLQSCGYRTATSSLRGRAVSVALIRGDESGDLRNGLAIELSKIPGFHYSSSTDADYRLEIKIVKDDKEMIGYNWDEQPITGELIKRLYPNEQRRKMSASVSLYETKSNRLVVGPFMIEGFSDYDFVNPTALKNVEFTDSQGSKQSVLHFSLGQLDSEEGAGNEAFRPLAQSLAHSIARALARAPLNN